MSAHRQSIIKLTGLNADNLLGFMASLGVLRSASEIWDASTVRMAWEISGSSYSPVLFLPEIDLKSFLPSLHTHLQTRVGHAALTIDKDLKISLNRFSVVSKNLAASFLNGSDAWGAKMIAAFGCGISGNEDGNIEDTAFRTMSGAGHQHFLEFMNLLAKETTLNQLQEAIFGPWQYRDPSPIMRWDAADDRRYALRWDEPSKDPVKTVRGANRLAIESLPFFPVVPRSSPSVETTGFKGHRRNDTFFTWPIWCGALNADSVNSVLALPALQQSDTSSVALAPLGICAVFRSQRITLGKYRNFTPAKSL